MQHTIRLASQIDKSVNYVAPHRVGYLESRYVRRSPEYFIAYLSSQTGCNRGCRFCHLTSTEQFKYQDATKLEYLEQAETIIEHYRRENQPCKIAHLNMMSRGEVLANKHFLNSSTDILMSLGQLFVAEQLVPKFNLSTIMPVTLRQSLVELFPIITPTLYYSFYSVDPDWRRAWMPGAMDYNIALDLLREYQKVSRKIVKIHGAFIANENDSPECVHAMIDAMRSRDLVWEMNIVAYNPLTQAHGCETDRIAAIVNQFRSAGIPTKYIPPVGRDCGASCGSFYPVHDLTKNAFELH